MRRIDMDELCDERQRKCPAKRGTETEMPGKA